MHIILLRLMILAFERLPYDGASGRWLGYLGAFSNEARSLPGEDPQSREYTTFSQQQQAQQQAQQQFSPHSRQVP
jgi:hypothetical protein